MIWSTCISVTLCHHATPPPWSPTQPTLTHNFAGRNLCSVAWLAAVTCIYYFRPGLGSWIWCIFFLSFLCISCFLFYAFSFFLSPLLCSFLSFTLSSSPISSSLLYFFSSASSFSPSSYFLPLLPPPPLSTPPPRLNLRLPPIPFLLQRLLPPPPRTLRRKLLYLYKDSQILLGFQGVMWAHPRSFYKCHRPRRDRTLGSWAVCVSIQEIYIYMYFCIF